MAKQPRRQQDPTAVANQQVLDRRQERIDQQLREIPDLGLQLEKTESAADVLRDEWDKKAFGDEPKTVTRIVYGPDSLLDTCPAFKAAIEQHGREAYAAATVKAILQLGHRAVPDPVMQKGLFKAIQKFGVEQVAEAFGDRILNIPERSVDYETGDGEFGDPMLLGSNALRDCVARYGEQGRAYKFLSQRCIDVLGMRGYTLVLDKDGNQVKAGTLLMAWIPQHMAEARRRKFAAESESEVRAQEEAYMESADRLVRAAGRVGAGSRPLSPRETIRANAADREAAIGNDYEMGLRIERGDVGV